MIGKTLAGKYRIDRVLGAGGMGSVYAAEDVTTGARVAVKVILAHLPTETTGLIQRFEREARAAGSIDTEHITRCLDAGTDPDTQNPFMVLEYLVGEDLQHLIRRLGPIHPELALRIVAQACAGLVAAHRVNVVHRDIKPANIFLAKTSEGIHTVKLLDFGVAKIRRDPSDMQSDTAGLTQTGSMLGSPLYMSPEQARSTKNVDHRTDIWSMGVVLYQAIAGRTPYEHISGLGDLIIALCSDLPPPVQQFAPWIDPNIAAVVDRALRVDLRERFQTAEEMLDAIRALLPGGIEIRDDMMVPLDDATHDHIAPTFFRNLAGGIPVGRANTPAPISNPQPRVSGAPAAAISDSGARPAQTSQSAIATTGPGLAATQTPPQPRSFPMFAIVAASVIAGGAGVYAVTRPTASSAPITSASAASGAPIAIATTTASATPITSAPTSATTAPSVEPGSAAPAPSESASAKPAASAAVKPRSAGTAKANRPDHAVYGDRK